MNLWVIYWICCGFCLPDLGGTCSCIYGQLEVRLIYYSNTGMILSPRGHHHAFFSWSYHDWGTKPDKCSVYTHADINTHAHIYIDTQCRWIQNEILALSILQYNKSTKNFGQVRIIPGLLWWLSIRLPINIIHHLNRWEENSYLIKLKMNFNKTL